jgi:hypothetical protein
MKKARYRIIVGARSIQPFELPSAKPYQLPAGNFRPGGEIAPRVAEVQLEEDGYGWPLLCDGTAHSNPSLTAPSVRAFAFACEILC